MEPEKVMNLFDSCWFDLELFKKQPEPSNSLHAEQTPDPRFQEKRSETEDSSFFDSPRFDPEIFKKQPKTSNSSNSDQYPDPQFRENPPESKLSSLATIEFNSCTELLSSKGSTTTSFTSDSISSDFVFSSESHLQTIPSGKDFAQIDPTFQPKKVGGVKKRKAKKGLSKSLSELEFEEVKGFMDLGFVFSEDDKDSILVDIIPGLQRLGAKKKDGEEEKRESSVYNNNESSVSRPYLSEAWEALERREKSNSLMNWRVPAARDGVELRESLKWWAHTVASTVR